MKIAKIFSKAKFFTIKYAPDILMGAGITSVITGTILACRGSIKAKEIIDEHNLTMDNLKDYEEHLEGGGYLDTPDGPYTLEDVKKDRIIVYKNTCLDLAKEYLPAILCEAAGITCILVSHGLLSKRNLILSGLYTTAIQGFKDYRKRIRDAFGEDVDRKIYLGSEDVKIKETVDDDGKKRTVEKKIEVVENPIYSPYAKVFDESNPNWEKSAENNLFFLNEVQRFMNQRLAAEGRIFLNDVYKELGFEPTKAGQVVGWVYDAKNPVGDNYIDFGIYDIYTRAKTEAERKAAFINGYERSIILDFNVDGNIWELMT